MTFALEPSGGDPKTRESTIIRTKTEKEQMQDLFYEKNQGKEDDPLPSEIFSPFVQNQGKIKDIIPHAHI